MSDQFTMQRADLAKKDKGELQTIIAALGGKSSARDKKDALIDQLLQLSGVTTDAEAVQQDAAREGTASEAAGETSSSSQEPEPAAPSAEVTGAADAAASTSSGDAPSDDAEPARGTHEPRKRQQREPQSGQGARGEQAKKATQQDADTSARTEGSQSGAARAGASNDDAATNTASDDEGEAGNRRRRRRGRGRDSVAEDSQTSDLVPVSGFLDLHDSGYGFLRVDGHRQSANDVYVAVKMARTLALRRGDLITGSSRPAQRNEKNPALQQVDSVGSMSVDEARDRPEFDELTPVHASENLIMEREGATNPTGRVLDLVTPLAKGHRGLIVSPAKSGKTEMIAEIATSVEANHGEVTLFVVQLDERPEEVTKMRRAIPSAEIVASAFGRPADEHISAVELTLERAKRLAETGNDVVVLLDGLSRLIRAYNMASQGNNRVGVNSIDAAALYAAKRCFGAACKLEEGGSITIIATIADGAAGSLDAAVLDEFRDAANVEIYLDHALAELGIYPPIDVAASMTRDENLLMDERSFELVRKARQSVVEPVSDDTGAPLIRILEAFAKNPSTEDFLNEFA